MDLSGFDFPGQGISRQLKKLGWSQRDLAVVLGIPLRQANQLLKGEQRFTPRMALACSEAFGGDAREWLDLEAKFRLSKEVGSGDEVRRRMPLLRTGWKEMVARGWFDGGRSPDAVEKNLCRFLKVKNLADVSPESVGCFRKSTPYFDSSIDQIAWCRRAIDIAGKERAKKFLPSRFEAALAELREIVPSEEGLEGIPELLANAGVRLVVVRHLPKTKIDGAMLWADSKKTKPIIALSLRYGRIDYFWFSLIHECMHLLLGHEPSVDSEVMGVNVDLPPEEHAANVEAARWLVSADHISEFLDRTNCRPTRFQIEEGAEEMGVHPGILLGQLHYRGILSYSTHRDLLVSVRERVLECVNHDGWEGK